MDSRIKEIDEVNKEELIRVLGRESDAEDDWLKCHPSLSWSLILSALLRAQKRNAALHITKTFRVKGKYD